MRNVLSLVLIPVLLGCATERIRTKWTDPNHRVFVNPEGLTEEEYATIQTAFVGSGKFFVVDRSTAFNALKSEQDMIHRRAADRFEDQEKYAWYGKLLSVGAVIVARQQCIVNRGFFVWTQVCKQYVSAVDTSTGLVIAAVANTAECSYNDGYPEWDDTVEKFNKAFPKTWEPARYDKKMVTHRKATEENAIRAKERSLSSQE